MEQTTLHTVIGDSLKRAITYPEYRELVHQLAEEGSTSGNEKTEDLANYTKLNDRRMKRWDKTLKIAEDQKQKLTNYKENLTWLVIAESWCGDAAHVIPVLNKIAETAPHIQLKIVFRDENETLMNAFLTNGGKSIAKLIIIDNDTNEVLYSWGPRPTEATKLVNDYKVKHGTLTEELKEQLQSWYNKDKGQGVINDLIDLLDI